MVVVFLFTQAYSTDYKDCVFGEWLSVGPIFDLYVYLVIYHLSFLYGHSIKKRLITPCVDIVQIIIIEIMQKIIHK